MNERLIFSDPSLPLIELVILSVLNTFEFLSWTSKVLPKTMNKTLVLHQPANDTGYPNSNHLAIISCLIS